MVKVHGCGHGRAPSSSSAARSLHCRGGGQATMPGRACAVANAQSTIEHDSCNEQTPGGSSIITLGPGGDAHPPGITAEHSAKIGYFGITDRRVGPRAAILGGLRDQPSIDTI
jgi:hypothetical protein